jgi:Rv0078B-related antitoxin
MFFRPGRDPAVVSEPPLEYRRLMTAITALEKQIERYRQMTGEQRLAVALELHELSCEIAREGIRRANPAADAAEVEQLLRRRLELVRAE